MGASTQASDSPITMKSSSIAELDWRSMPLTSNVLIEASAGTGKTYTLILVLIRMILERRLAPSQIMVMTYTDAATSELRERLSARLWEMQHAMNHPDLASQVARSAVDKHESQVARSAVDKHESQVARSAVDKNESQVARSAGDKNDALSKSPDPLLMYLYARWQDASIKQLDHQLIKRALRQVAQMPIHTIHGMCQFLLASFAINGLDEAAIMVDGKQLEAQFIDDALLRRFSKDAIVPFERQFISKHFLRDLKAALSQCLMHARLRFAKQPAPNEDAVTTAARFVRTRISELSELLTVRYALLKAPQIAVRNVLKKLNSNEALQLPDVEFVAQAKLEDSRKSARALLRTNGGFMALLELYQQLKTAQDRYFAKQLEEIYREVCQQTRSQLAFSGKQSFQSMLSALADALDPPKPTAIQRQHARQLADAIRARFPVALIDEFQDTDAEQWVAFRKIYPSSGLFLVGDPKQSIYRFRGSDVHIFAQAKRASQVYALRNNYRASAELIEALNGFYAIPDPFLQDAIGFEPIAKPSLVDAEINAQGAAGIEAPKNAALNFYRTVELDPLELACAQIAQKYRERQSQNRVFDCALLCATHREIQMASERLRAWNIPVAAVSSESVLNGPAGRAIIVVMRACLNLTDEGILRASVQALQQLDLEKNALPTTDAVFAWAHALQAHWQRFGVVRLLQSLQAQVSQSVLQSISQAQWEIDIAQLSDWLGSEEAKLKAALSPTLDERERFALMGGALLKAATTAAQHDRATNRQLRAKSASAAGSSAVQIMTIFVAKGLEFDEVYLPSLGKSFRDSSVPILPQSNANGQNSAQLVCDVSGVEIANAKALEQREQLSERLRMQYVALTRARQAVHVQFSAKQLAQSNTSPLAWHLEAMAGAHQASSISASIGVFGPEAGTPAVDSLDCLRACPAAQVVDVHEVPIIEPVTLPEINTQGLRDQMFPEAIIHAPFRAMRSRLSFTSLMKRLSVAPTQTAEQFDSTLAVHASEEMTESDSALREELRLQGDLDRASLLLDIEQRVHPELEFLSQVRGAGFGLLVHAQIEQVLRGEAMSVESLQRLAASLAIEPALTDELLTAILYMVRRSLELPLLPGMRLAELKRSRLCPELHFEFPLPNLDLSALHRLSQVCELPSLFSESHLRLPRSALLETHGGLPRSALLETNVGLPRSALLETDVGLPRSALLETDVGLPRSALLETQQASLSGAMIGAIDLVFQHAGKFYLLDYKTNDLGHTAASYAPDSLAQAMHSHGYHLQHVLYQFALHRYLQMSYSGYRHAQHFGGAIYLFTRAAILDNDADLGVYRHCLTEHALTQLAMAFGLQASNP
jgi:exodeoxyribonuclease V beta subunit